MNELLLPVMMRSLLTLLQYPNLNIWIMSVSSFLTSLLTWTSLNIKWNHNDWVLTLMMGWLLTEKGVQHVPTSSIPLYMNQNISSYQNACLKDFPPKAFLVIILPYYLSLFSGHRWTPRFHLRVEFHLFGVLGGPIIAKPKKNKNCGIRASSISMSPPSCGKWTKGILDKG